MLFVLFGEPTLALAGDPTVLFALLANQRSHLHSGARMTCARAICAVARAEQRSGRRSPSAHRSNLRGNRTLSHPDPAGRRQLNGRYCSSRTGFVKSVRVGGRQAITDSTTPSDRYDCGRPAVFDLSGQGEIEFCFCEICFYEQRAIVVRSAVLLLQQNRSRVRALLRITVKVLCVKILTRSHAVCRVWRASCCTCGRMEGLGRRPRR